MQQLTKKTVSCFNVRDWTGISLPTNFTWRTLDRILQRFDACFIKTQNPSKNSPRILQVTFLEGEIRPELKHHFFGRARSLELTIWDFWCACKRSPKASGYTVKSFAGRKRNAKLWNFAVKTTFKTLQNAWNLFWLLVSFRCLTHNTYSLCASMSLLANSKGKCSRDWSVFCPRKTGNYSVAEVPGSTARSVQENDIAHMPSCLWYCAWWTRRP